MNTPEMTPQQADRELVGLISDVLGDHRPSPEREPGRVDQALWGLLSRLGLVRLTGSQASRGSEASWYDAAALHELAAAHGLQLPLVEHDLLAGWLLERTGLDPTPGITTLGWVDRDQVARDVPWARAAESIVLVHPESQGRHRVQVVTPSHLTLRPSENVAGEPRDTLLEVPDTAGPVGQTVTIDAGVAVSVRHRAALARAIQLCGAMDAAIESARRHTSERVQFGRPLSQFQAVQHRLADAAAEAALARAATRAAIDEAVATDFTGPGLDVAIAVARSCAGHAGSVVVRAVHQLHGAIGTTREHALHLVTTPILAWSNEYGTVAGFDAALTRAAVAAGPEGVWSLVSDPRSSAVPAR